jgi:hypothetical protein
MDVSFRLAGMQIAPAAFQSVEEQRLNELPPSPAFIEMTRRVKDVNFNQKFAEIKNLEEKTNDLLAVIQEQDWWKNELFSNDEFPWLALYAVKIGSLSANHCADICSLWSKTLEIEGPLSENLLAVPIAVDGKPNPRIITMLLKQADESEHETSREEIEKIISGVIEKGIPLEQHLFFVDNRQGEPLTPFEKVSGKVEKSISHAVLAQGQFNFLSFCNGVISEKGESKERAHPYRMVPSISFADSLFSGFFGEKCIRPNPVLGSSSVNDIRKNGDEGSRDIGILFPGISLPNSADDFPVKPGFDFTLHDLYHLYIASNVGKNHCHAIRAASEIFKKTLQDKKGPNSKIVNHMRWKLDDMEHGDYREKIAKFRAQLFFPADTELTISHIFWMAIYRRAQVDSYVEAAKEGPQDEESVIARLFDIKRKIIQTGALQALVSEVNKNKEAWWDKYKISTKALLDCEAAERVQISNMRQEFLKQIPENHLIIRSIDNRLSTCFFSAMAKSLKEESVPLNEAG